MESFETAQSGRSLENSEPAGGLWRPCNCKGKQQVDCATHLSTTARHCIEFERDIHQIGAKLMRSFRNCEVRLRQRCSVAIREEGGLERCNGP
jgi:hypothetical protein